MELLRFGPATIKAQCCDADGFDVKRGNCVLKNLTNKVFYFGVRMNITGRERFVGLNLATNKL